MTEVEPKLPFDSGAANDRNGQITVILAATVSLANTPTLAALQSPMSAGSTAQLSSHQQEKPPSTRLYHRVSI